MTQTGTNAPAAPGKGKAFFDRGDQVAETGNWDFAIEMYLQGIQREPGNVDRGHKRLREVSLARTAKGGKPAGMMEKMKRGPAKDPVTSMVNAEYLLAKEPGSEANMLQVLKSAITLSLPEVIKWICAILTESQRQARKKSRKILQDVTSAYHDIEEYKLAIGTCEMARDLEPGNGQIQNILKDLEAKETIKRGQYGPEGTFLKSVKDLVGQQKLIQKDKIEQTVQYRKQQVEEARKEYLRAPTVPGKINGYVEALISMQDESFENEAIDVLTKAHQDTNNYAFRARIGDIRMRQFTRRFRKLRDAGDKHGAMEAARHQLEFELQEYGERAVNYPTDMSIKYELGRRQLLALRFDEAIGSLQQAKRDPRHTIHANLLLGQAFEKKGMYREAADTFEAALKSELPEERAKEMRYSLGEVYEKMNELKKAEEQYSQVAQMDYNFKDVRVRLQEIRKKFA